jgi:hypothetical protein
MDLARSEFRKLSCPKSLNFWNDVALGAAGKTDWKRTPNITATVPEGSSSLPVLASGDWIEGV